MNTLVRHGSASKLLGTMLSQTAQIMKGSKSGVSQFALFKKLQKALKKNSDNTVELKAMLKRINTPASKEYLARIDETTLTKKQEETYNA